MAGGARQEVHRGDIVAVVDTSKAAIDIEVFEDGVIDDIVVPAGSQVPVGTVLARITPSRPAEAPVPDQPKQAVPKQAVPKQAVPRHEEVVMPFVRSPLVRREAAQLGIDLATLHGSGPGGLITREDVEQAAALQSRRVRSSPYARRRAAELGIDLGSVAGSGPRGAVRAADLMQAQHPAPSSVEPVKAGAAEIPAPARQDEIPAPAKQEAQYRRAHLAAASDAASNRGSDGAFQARDPPITTCRPRSTSRRGSAGCGPATPAGLPASS